MAKPKVLLIDYTVSSLGQTEARLSSLPVDIWICSTIEELEKMVRSGVTFDLIVFDLVFHSVELGSKLNDYFLKSPLKDVPKILFTKYAWKIKQQEVEHRKIAIIQLYKRVRDRADVLGVVDKPEEQGLMQGIENVKDVVEEFVGLFSGSDRPALSELKANITDFIRIRGYAKSNEPNPDLP